MTDRLAEIKARAEKATPGPWLYNTYSGIICGLKRLHQAHEEAYREWEKSGSLVLLNGNLPEPYRSAIYDTDPSVATVPSLSGDTATGRHQYDAEFIAHARSDIPWLIEQLERAHEALRKIYGYRSDDPDWNMVMAIAGSIVEPTEIYFGD